MAASQSVALFVIALLWLLNPSPRFVLLHCSLPSPPSSPSVSSHSFFSSFNICRFRALKQTFLAAFSFLLLSFFWQTHVSHALLVPTTTQTLAHTHTHKCNGNGNGNWSSTHSAPNLRAKRENLCLPQNKAQQEATCNICIEPKCRCTIRGNLLIKENILIAKLGNKKKKRKKKYRH